MGRYNNGNATYDKSYYLSLWSTPGHINRDLKGVRTKIIEPKLQLTVCTHPWSVVSTLISNILKCIYLHTDSLF
jgi:hypothetical protein